MLYETLTADSIVAPALPDYTDDREYYKNKRWNKHRLNEAIVLHGQPELRTKTLLTKTTHERHSEWLSARFLATFTNLYNQKSVLETKINADRCVHGLLENDPLTQKLYASKHVRFFTVLYEVVELDSDQAIRSVLAMSKIIKKIIGSIKGLHCLGAAEVEPISIPLLELLDEHRSNRAGINALDDSTGKHRQEKLVKDHRFKTSRKFVVCNELWTGFSSPVFSGNYTQLLVHFHGVLIADHEDDFTKLEKKLKKYPQFHKVGYQIEIKKLTEEAWGWERQIKTPTENLECIAKYLTKGAPSRTNENEAEYKFKVKFDHGYAIGDVQSKALESMDDLIVDVANQTSISHTFRVDLTKHEVIALADIINKMMALKKDRTGYLIQVRGWSSKAKT